MENEPRQRILLLLKFLLEQTDEAHYVSVADVLRFWEAHGIHGNRKNVYSDIQLLMDSGVDVICIRNMQNRYFIGSRLLELPELTVSAVPAPAQFACSAPRGRPWRGRGMPADPPPPPGNFCRKNAAGR